MMSPPAKRKRCEVATAGCSGGGGGGGSSSSGGGMDPEVARRLQVEGATIVVLDVPPGTEFGIDMNSWNTGDKFLGVKMIPPGVHFVYYSSVNVRERLTGPRTGFFYNFGRGELVARRWDPQVEDIVDGVGQEQADRMKADLRNMDGRLGAYPYDSWKKWVSLANRISDATLNRLEPLNRKISSVTDLVPAAADPAGGGGEQQAGRRQGGGDEEEPRLPAMAARPGTEIRYTRMWSRRFPEGSTPAQISRHSMDSTHQLTGFMASLDQLYGDQVSSSMSDRSHAQEVLAELQFSFLCFLVGMNYDSFERWKRLVTMMCNCSDGLVRFPGLFVDFISDLYFQMREVPDDFFVDIVSSSNFLVASLTKLFVNLDMTQDVDAGLRRKAARFEASLTKKFGWEFSREETDEEAPVVVEIEAV